LSIAAAHTPPALSAALQENARVFAIGVSRYDAWPDRPVRSATANALAWLVVALRMGVTPYGNPLMVEEAGDRGVLAARLRGTLDEADMDESEREGLRELLADVEVTDEMGWNVARPEYASILEALILLGNHLEYSPTCRLLVTWSGHGAIDRGTLVLCPSDAVPSPAAPTAAELQARLGEATRELAARGGKDPTYATAIKLLQTMGREATRKAVLAELLDVVRAPLADMGTRYGAEVILDLLRFVARNLTRVLAQSRLPKAAFGRVLTPVHLMLALGEHDRRVTLVLDACHSGGPSDALQGTMAGHTWTNAGLRCRIMSASQGAQLAAEARIGDRRFSAATWALTQVLSRWQRVEDGPAYALGIRNGELVQRANLLLSALSFRQQISLHATPPEPGCAAAADMPFFGLEPTTRTVVDPDVYGDGIELSSGTNDLTTWTITQGGALRAVLLAVGSSAPGWTFAWPIGQPTVTRVYQPNKLYVFSSAGNVQFLAGNGFNVVKSTWNGQGTPPASFTTPIGAFANAPLCSVLASGDPGERAYQGVANPGGTFSYQLNGGSKVVYLRWLAPYGGDNGKLHFISKQAFPYTPADFGTGGMAFAACPIPSFDGSCVEHLIAL
jgi:hypothetical protein